MRNVARGVEQRVSGDFKLAIQPHKFKPKPNPVVALKKRIAKTAEREQQSMNLAIEVAKEKLRRSDQKRQKAKHVAHDYFRTINATSVARARPR